MNVRDFVNKRSAELSAQGIDFSQHRELIDKDLVFRGAPVADLRDGRINQQSFMETELTPTIREHINQLAEQGLTKDEIDLDMVNRGFYDVDRNVKENFNELLPEKLNTVRHKEIMEGSKILGLIPWDQPWAEAKASGRFTAHDPWTIPELKKSRDRLAGMRAGFNSTFSEEVLDYMDYLKSRETRPVAMRGLGGSIAGARSRTEPNVSPEVKERAREIYKIREDLTAARSAGSVTGLGRSVAQTVDMLAGTNLLKEDDQTRYHRVPVLDSDGNQVKNKVGKPKFQLIESEEELLKTQQGQAFTMARKTLNDLVKLRLESGLGLTAKAREEVIDFAQGMADLTHLLLPLLANQNASAMAVYEKMISDPKFNFEDAKFQEAMQGYRGGAGIGPAILAYLAPVANSIAINAGMSDRMTAEESQRATAMGIPLPITTQLKQQAQAFPIDTFFTLLPVMKMLKGLGSVRAAKMFDAAVVKMRKSGMSEEAIARKSAEDLSKHMSDQQKSYMRRILESKLIKDTENKFVKALGPAADVVSTGGKAAILAVTMGDTTGALGEAAAFAGIGASSRAINVAIKANPRLRRALTPEIWASDHVYKEGAGRQFADNMADAQNIIDSANMQAAQQAGRGDIAALDGIPNIENLPAAMQDNAARIAAAVEVDPFIVDLKNTVEKLDRNSPDYEPAVVALEEAKRNRYIELAEESGLVTRESALHDGLTDINRERGKANSEFDESVRVVEQDARKEFATLADELADETDLVQAGAEFPARRERLDLEDAESRVEYELGIADARRVRDEALEDLNLGRKRRVQKAEQRLAKAKDQYKQSLQKADEADRKIVETGKRKLDSVLSSKSKNREVRQRRIKKVRDEVAATRQRSRFRYSKTHNRIKANIQRLTEAKQFADKQVGAKVSIAQRMFDIERRYSKTANRLKRNRDKQMVANVKQQLALDLEEGRLSRRTKSQRRAAQLSEEFGRGDVDFATVRDRTDLLETELFGAQVDATQRRLNEVRAKRNQELDALYNREQDILNMMKHEYEVTMRMDDGHALADPLFKQKRYHVFYDIAASDEGVAFQAVPVDAVDDSVRQAGVDTVTYQDPASDPVSIAARISQLPIEEQIGTVAAIKKAAKQIAKSTRGLTSSALKGGGRNAVYRYIYHSMTSALFDELSPKFLRSNEMRNAFKDFATSKISAELGIPQTPRLVTDVEKLINNFASPRAVEKGLFAEISYTMYTRQGDNFVAAADLSAIYKEFLITQVSKKQLRRIAIESIQADLPVLQMRVGVNAATDTLLKQSGTSLYNFRRGVYVDGEVNWPYVSSIVETFKNQGHLPITFRLGNKIVTEIDGVRRSSRQLLKALFQDRDADVRAMLGNKYDDFRKAIEEELIQISETDAPRQYQFISDMEQFNKLDDFRVIGEGRAPDQLKGIKTLHPAISADRVRTSIGAFAEKGSGKSDIVVHKEYGELAGWLLRTNEYYNTSGSMGLLRGLTALFKLAKTALNLGNHITNFLSNQLTLTLSEGLDPITANAIIMQGGRDMLLFRFDPDSLPVEVRQQFAALLETGGINQTILVQEVDAVLQSFDGQGSRAVGLAHAALTGRFPDGSIPFSKIDGTKGEIVRAPFELSAAYADAMKTGYRMFGDEMFKFIKARLDMIENAKYLEDMQPGRGQSFFDLSRGQYKDPPLIAHVHKTPDGEFMVVRPDGKIEKGRQAVLKVNAEASMASANAYYFNLADLGTLQRKAVQLEGVGLSTFLSWRLHSLDIPGLKKGLFYRTLIGEDYRFSTDPIIAGNMAANEIAKAGRRAMIGMALKRRDTESTEWRDTLPSYYKNAFINSDLTLMLADNQIPFSGFLSYLTGAGRLAEMADPAAAKRRLFFNTVFPHTSTGNAFADLLSPPMVDLGKIIFNIDPRDNKPFETTGEQLDALFRMVSDGKYLVPRKVLQSFLDQQSAITLGDIKDLDQKLVLRRDVLRQQAQNVQIMNALLMRRYQRLNPSRYITVIANAPKGLLNRFERKIEKEYSISFKNRKFVRNPFDFLIGRNVNEVNARLIADEIQKFKDLFGENSLQPGVTPGDKTQISGVFSAVAERLVQSMIQGLESNEKDQLQKSWQQAKSNGLSVDQEIYKNLEEMNGEP